MNKIWWEVTPCFTVCGILRLSKLIPSANKYGFNRCLHFGWNVCLIFAKEMDDNISEDDVEELIKAETDGIVFQEFTQS